MPKKRKINHLFEPDLLESVSAAIRALESVVYPAHLSSIRVLYREADRLNWTDYNRRKDSQHRKDPVSFTLEEVACLIEAIVWQRASLKSMANASDDDPQIIMLDELERRITEIHTNG